MAVKTGLESQIRVRVMVMVTLNECKVQAGSVGHWASIEVVIKYKAVIKTEIIHFFYFILSNSY